MKPRNGTVPSGPRQPFPAARRLALALATLTALASAGCSRAVSVGSTPPAVTYAVNVTNASNNDLAVFYDDGTGPRALGLVVAGRTERFIIAAPRSTLVAITGDVPGGSRIAGPVSVQLLPDEPVNVVLR